MSKVKVTSTGKGLRQEIQAGSHKITADAPKSVGGDESGLDPHELLMASLGACTAMTLKIFASKRDWKLDHVAVELDEEQVEEGGKKVTRLTRNIAVEGDLTQEQLDTLKQIADKCPIHKILVGEKIIETQLKTKTAIAK
jgi:putative redox protein